MLKTKTLVAIPLAIGLTLGLGACGDSSNGNKQETSEAASTDTQRADKAEEIRGKVLDTTAKAVELADETAKEVKEKAAEVVEKGGEVVEQTTEQVSGAIESATEAVESRIAVPSVSPEEEAKD
ncbi:MAG TPA: hypothetical protein DCF62_05965 [Porticoccaceae bacterium]|nr:hypothetical protein [Porticoccaceae bacterium]HCO60710.1 hypothetical protein [Porticoccaceae bacterium]